MYKLERIYIYVKFDKVPEVLDVASYTYTCKSSVYIYMSAVLVLHNRFQSDWVVRFIWNRKYKICSFEIVAPYIIRT